MSSRSSSRNFCWYHSSHSRVARSASIPLAVCRVSRLLALRLRPWICRRADVEGAAVPAEGALGVELQQHLRQAVIVRALLGAAGDVAQHLAGLLQREGDAVLAERRAQPPHVAEQVVAARDAVEETERPAELPSLLPRLERFHRSAVGPPAGRRAPGRSIGRA